MPTTAKTLPPTSPNRELFSGAAHALPRAVVRYAPLDAARDLAVEANADCLSARELAELAAWREPGRRRAWLAGRRLAKQLIASHLCIDNPMLSIEVLSRDSQGRVNRPKVWYGGIEQACSLSISHSARGVLVAIVAGNEATLGIDLSDAAELSPGLVNLWFTADERAWLDDSGNPDLARYIWCAKEALYKALSQGESFDPRRIEVLSGGRCRYHDAQLNHFGLRSWTIDGQLAVLATVATARYPVSVTSSSCR
jgi:4'-phosphopantetheinyl transferase EntD